MCYNRARIVVEPTRRKRAMMRKEEDKGSYSNTDKDPQIYPGKKLSGWGT